MQSSTLDRIKVRVSQPSYDNRPTTPRPHTQSKTDAGKPERWNFEGMASEELRTRASRSFLASPTQRDPLEQRKPTPPDSLPTRTTCPLLTSCRQPPRRPRGRIPRPTTPRPHTQSTTDAGKSKVWYFEGAESEKCIIRATLFSS